jgi:hypothetical protein
MEIASVRQRVLQAIDRAKRGAAERRVRMDEAAGEYATFLQEIAAPLFRQVANALKAEGYLFNVFTPGGSVRLMSDRSADDYIELVLDSTGNEPIVMGRTRRGRGQRVLESAEPLGPGPVRDLTEEDVLEFLVRELGPYVER